MRENEFSRQPSFTIQLNKIEFSKFPPKIKKFPGIFGMTDSGEFPKDSGGKVTKCSNFYSLAVIKA